jgi:2,4-dienoyl-CoA reductase-like NADH-dependent reductase (Old Yellow Enzyme family)
MYETLFTPYDKAPFIAPNRLVAQAMEINGAAPGGGVSDEIIERYRTLARGGWGVVFVEAISITEKHLARKNGLVLNKKNLDGFRRLTESFKKENDSSVLLFQVTHSGRQSGAFSKKIKAYEDDDKDIPLISEEGLNEIHGQFVDAAHLAREAGADGVDIKSCHGYLLGELLRPKNRRPDRYGNSPENRARLASSIISSIRGEFDDFICGARISLFEGIRGGCGTAGPDEVVEDFSDILDVISHLVSAGVHFLNISAGVPPLTPQITRPEKKCLFNLYHHFRYAKSVKERFSDVAVIGSAYSAGMGEAPALAEENLRRGYTDFVGFGRQTLADPLYPEKLLTKPDAIHTCILCGGCSRLLGKMEAVHCITYDKKRNGIVIEEKPNPKETIR